jgi:hypothetical protein
MKDPRRLDDGGGATDLERRLLASARSERPSPELRRRMKQGLALGTGAFGASAAAAGGVTKLGVVAWVSVGVLAAGFGGGLLGARIFTRAGSAPAARAPAAAQAPAPATAPAAVTPAARPAVTSTAEAPARAQSPSRPLRHGRPAAPVAGAGLRAEIRLIDAAREALAAQAPRRALEILQRYEASHPNGTFAPEATALRIEALQQSGEADHARLLARQFVAAHPDSPLAVRVGRLTR